MAAHAIAFTLVDGPVPPEHLQTAQEDLGSYALAPVPVITQSDIVAYDFDDGRCASHRFRLRPACVARLPRRPDVWGAPFVLMTGERRILLGTFLTSFSERWNSAPTIVVDRYDASTDCSPDWFWIESNYPHRAQGGRDPRADKDFVDALRASHLVKPLDDPAWTAPLSDWSGPVDGTSGAVVQLEPDLVAYANECRHWHPRVYGMAQRVDDAKHAAPIFADMDGNGCCKLPLAPGVYKVSGAIGWEARGMPPRLRYEVREISAGVWTTVTVRRLTIPTAARPE